MRQPSFVHLTGQAMWRRCDFDRTRIVPNPARVMLAPQASAAAAATDPAPWLGVRGAAAVLPCPPDLCADAAVTLADPAHGLFALAPEGWRALPVPRPRIHRPAGGAFDFAPMHQPAPLAPPAGIARDKAGRVWLLDRTPPRLRVLAPDLSLLDTLPLPAGATPAQMVVASWCVAVTSGANLLVQPFGGVWQSVPLPAPAIAIAADAEQAIVVALLPGPRIAVLTRSGLQVHDLPELKKPLFLLVLGADSVLAGEPVGAPGAAVETCFVQFSLTSADGPTAVASFGVRSFDGRAVWLDCGTVYASTAAGSRALYPRELPVETIGSVESFALDSTIFACAWHRVFVDACLAVGTAITLEAKTTDDLPPLPILRPPRPPADISAPLVPVAAEDPWKPLLSLQADEAGWWPVGVLDTRGAQADIVDPPERIVRPSEDPLGPQRSSAVAPWPQVTLEGLIKAPPGRYLALRITLSGTARSSPAVLALRATYQRPSLLEHLPAFWRADPVAADATDRALALFEGWVTETDARITALRELADPRLVPPEALDWLASYVALTFDQRIDEAVRRQLLSEIVALYQQRGTLPGLTRLLSILARAPVTVVEDFRLRRQSSVFLNNDAIIGPGLQLGDAESMAVAEDPADVVLEADYAALMLRRELVRAQGGTPCPPADPPYPIEADPLARFVRRFAHRFTVVLPCRRTDTLEAVIQDAVEANKPAHTLHTLCWLDAGFQLGRALVGLSRLGETPCFEPSLLGTAVLGSNNTIGRYEPDTRFRPGQRLTRDHRSLQERTARS